MVTPKSRKWSRIDEKEAEEKRMLNRYANKTSEDEGPRQEPGRSKAFKAAKQIESIFFSLEYEDFEAMFQGQRRFDAKFNIWTALSDCFRQGGGHSLTGALCCMGRLYSCCCSKRKRTGRKRKVQKKRKKLLHWVKKMLAKQKKVMSLH